MTLELKKFDMRTITFKPNENKGLNNTDSKNLFDMGRSGKEYLPIDFEVICSVVNIRLAPEMTGKVVGTFRSGQRLKILTKKDNWAKVQLGAWVHMSCLRVL